MLEFGACPRCHLEIDPARRAMKPMICNHCGFTGAKAERLLSQNLEKQIITSFGVLSAIILAGYIQLMNWDGYALEIIPLTFREVIGMSSQADNERTAQICLELKKYDCTEKQYSRIAQADPTQLKRLADFQMKRANYNGAAQSYYEFFQKGGLDLEASYNYAKALAQLGKIDEATQYFEQVLAARPDVLQVTVIYNYVKLLMDGKRYADADKLIQRIRKNGGVGADMFMEAEVQKIRELTTASRD